MEKTGVLPTVPAKPRFVGIDLVKILACFLVVSVHFFLYSGFYSEPITTEFGQVAIYFRWIAYCCVPLFMITTGYLMKNKTLSKGYYLGLLRVCILYLIISVICFFFDMHFYPNKYDAQSGYTVWQFIKGIFMFTDAQYAWYVEYYICIFLLLPFINAAFNGLKTRNQKLAMVITVTALSVFSQSLYLGTQQNDQIRLIPGYFVRCYPIAYYLIGAFIREYPPKRTLANKIYFLSAYIISLVWLSTSTFQHSLTNTENNNIMLSWHYNDYGSWPVAVCSAALFLMLFDITSTNKAVCRITKTVSEATFACYLISYMFDTRYYLSFVGKYSTVAERCQNAYKIILAVFGSAMVCALVLQGLYSLCDKGVRRAYAKSAAKKAALAAASAEGSASDNQK